MFSLQKATVRHLLREKTWDCFVLFALSIKLNVNLWKVTVSSPDPNSFRSTSRNLRKVLWLCYHLALV